MRLRIYTLCAGLLISLATVAVAASDAVDVAAADTVAAPVMRDGAGNEGRVHTVVRGDTLWHVAETYFGSPFLWPSLWKANSQIANPNRIYPGDRLFITAHGIRPLGDGETLTRGTGAAAGSGDLAPVNFSTLEAAGFLASDSVEVTGHVVGGPHPARTMFAEGDVLHIDGDAGQLRPGAQLTIFRATADARDPDTDVVIGRYVDVLGWAEVQDVQAGSARVLVRESFGEIHIGDAVMPRNPSSTTIRPAPAPSGIEGRIVYLPHARSYMTTDDVVYLDRGAAHGLAVGNSSRSTGRAMQHRGGGEPSAWRMTSLRACSCCRRRRVVPWA